jgi:hypothetical protein
MQADAAQFNLLAFGRCGPQQAGKLCERHAERSPVEQFDPHRVLVKANAGCRNGHAMPSE